MVNHSRFLHFFLYRSICNLPIRITTMTINHERKKSSLDLAIHQINLKSNKKKIKIIQNNENYYSPLLKMVKRYEKCKVLKLNGKVKNRKNCTCKIFPCSTKCIFEICSSSLFLITKTHQIRKKKRMNTKKKKCDYPVK